MVDYSIYTLLSTHPSPDGKTLITVDSDYSYNRNIYIIYIWDLEYNKKLATFSLSNQYSSGAFSPDSSKFIAIDASFSYQKITMIDINRLEIIKEETIYERTCIMGVSNDGKSIITGDMYGNVNILDFNTFELKSSFMTGATDIDVLDSVSGSPYAFNPDTNQIAVLTNYSRTLKIFDISGKTLNTMDNPWDSSWGSRISYFGDNYICLENIVISLKDNTVFCKDGYGIIPLYYDLFLNGDEIVNMTKKNVIAKLTKNPEIFKILPDKKLGIGKNGIYDLSPLFRKVKNIELSIPEIIDVGYSEPISATVIFNDNTKKTLKYGEFYISSSSARTLQIDNDKGIFSANGLGKVTVTAEYFGFTAEKEINIMVFPQPLTAKSAWKTVELSWSAPSAANLNGYYIYKTTEPGVYESPMQDIPIKGDVLTFTDEMLEPDTQYYYTYKLVFADGTLSPASNEVSAMIKTNRTLAMQINNPYMVIHEDEYVEVDPGRGTVPFIKNNRTLVPIRVIIEAFEGTVEWNGDEQEIVMTLGENTVTMWINELKALVNGEEKILDVAPTIFNSRTFVPVRFVTENLKLNVQWEATHSLIVISEKPIDNILECMEVIKLLNPPEEPEPDEDIDAENVDEIEEG